MAAPVEHEFRGPRRRLVETLLRDVPPDAATQRDRLREVVRAVDGLIPREALG